MALKKAMYEKVALRPAAAAAGCRKCLTEEHIDAICLMIEDNMAITMKAIQEKILVDFGLAVAISIILNYLQGVCWFWRKVMHNYIPVVINNERNKALRAQYVRRISPHMQWNKTIIWIMLNNFQLSSL